ncbi:161R [Cherax quadricarinatus iridovirus]|uniref:Uncharacterized protein n=1 Tax=Shrimp hemocyte iridescent virus TaxID=2039780 RepID=A0A291B101_9VIRU|nr:161R [Cherax quadricarinatus iridovirus]YP_010084918.1 hypothetical protein KM509_gp166 [Shrimp hemocyte iridescent virus]UPA43305.1 hypothetical protein 4TH000031 [Iridovirus CN01]ASZ85141.1 161R [Cherax quadricarinatus iridovirus]ATE87175.1 hypothetical protein [Shrimp hemocyte iridescent virus]UPA43540.1 hypothetical protein 3TG000107 [Iridovirus CN01]
MGNLIKGIVVIILFFSLIFVFARSFYSDPEVKTPQNEPVPKRNPVVPVPKIVDRGVDDGLLETFLDDDLLENLKDDLGIEDLNFMSSQEEDEDDIVEDIVEDKPKPQKRKVIRDVLKKSNTHIARTRGLVNRLQDGISDYENFLNERFQKK